MTELTPPQRAELEAGRREIMTFSSSAREADLAKSAAILDAASEHAALLDAALVDAARLDAEWLNVALLNASLEDAERHNSICVQ